MRILIVDDHPIVASGCRAVLADEGEIALLEAADAESGVEREAAGGNHADGDENVAAAEAHDGTFAVALLDLRDRCVQQFRFFVCHITPR